MLLPADLPIIQALYTKALPADEGHLRPAAAYVLIYEMLFGQVRKLRVCICYLSHAVIVTSWDRMSSPSK